MSWQLAFLKVTKMFSVMLQLEQMPIHTFKPKARVGPQRPIQSHIVSKVHCAVMKTCKIPLHVMHSASSIHRAAQTASKTGQANFA